MGVIGHHRGTPMPERSQFRGAFRGLIRDLFRGLIRTPIRGPIRWRWAVMNRRQPVMAWGWRSWIGSCANWGARSISRALRGKGRDSGSRSKGSSAPTGPTSKTGKTARSSGRATSRTAAEGEGREPAPRRILVVEDYPPTRDALQKLLELYGWEVTIADTLRDALVALNQPLRWIVLDLMLPDGDGAEVLHTARQREMEVGVIVTTAVTDADRLQHVRNQQPDALLNKPLDFDRLLSLVE